MSIGLKVNPNIIMLCQMVGVLDPCRRDRGIDVVRFEHVVRAGAVGVTGLDYTDFQVG